MKTVIWKYELPEGKLSFELKLPLEAIILDVQYQLGIGGPVLWAAVPVVKNSALESRYFQVVMTGEEFDSTNTKYIGTFQFPHGIVSHLFEVYYRAVSTG